LRRIDAQGLDLIGDLDVLCQVKIVKPVLPSQSGHNGIAEIWKARQDCIKSIRLQMGTDGGGMPGVEKHGSHSRETEVFDKPLRSIEADVTKTDLVVSAFR
jgi:hypothetical protein